MVERAQGLKVLPTPCKSQYFCLSLLARALSLASHRQVREGIGNPDDTQRARNGRNCETTFSKQSIRSEVA